MTTPPNENNPHDEQPFRPPAYQAPQQPGQPGGFPGAAPAAPYPAPGGPVPTLPVQLNRAFWLYVAAPIVGLIGSLISIGGVHNAIQNQLARSGQTIGANAVDAATGLAIGVSIFLAVVGIVLFVLFAWLMKRGNGWARIVLTILTILTILNVTGAYYIGALVFILAAIATVFTWLRSSNEYFKAVKAAKTGRYLG